MIHTGGVIGSGVLTSDERYAICGKNTEKRRRESERGKIKETMSKFSNKRAEEKAKKTTEKSARKMRHK